MILSGGGYIQGVIDFGSLQLLYCAVNSNIHLQVTCVTDTYNTKGLCTFKSVFQEFSSV